MSSLVHLGRVAAARAELARPPRTQLRDAVPSAGHGSTAADLMTHRPPVVHSRASLWSAWDLLHRSGARHLVVVDGGHRPLGVLDDRTVALEWPPGPLAAHRTLVGSLLRDRTRPRVLEDADLGAVVRTMVGARADALPVVDREGRLLGLVTLWHLAELAAGVSIPSQSPAV